jgi:biofilm protein TabA
LIVDTLARLRQYAAVHPAFARAFDFLEQTDLRALEPGRHEIDGDRLYVSIEHIDGRGQEGARLEAHQRYIDIQFTIEGAEEIGWMPLRDCRSPSGPFDDGTDIGFFDDRPTTWIHVPAGEAAIFFQYDAHAPRGGRGAIKKAIVKVASVYTSAPARSRADPR